MQQRTQPDGGIDRLRADIDGGRTGDKVQTLDPAAAPLGTDEEAAGTPIKPSIAEAARHQERSRTQHAVQQRGPGAAWLLIAFIALFAVATVAAIYYSR